MADLAQIIANIDGYKRYETDRAIDLANQAQNMQNQQNAQIMDLKTQLANLQDNPYAKWGIWDPQGRHQQLLNEDQQLKIASKWASSIKNLAPEKRAQGYAQFLKAMPGLGIDVSDMPQGYDEGYINQLADLGIETETRYQNEQQNARQERQIAATAANLERQIAAQREARQDEFDKKLAAFDYEQGYKTKQQKEMQAQTDDFIKSLGLDEDATRRLLAKSRGIELNNGFSLKEQSEIAKNLGLTANPEALNEGRFEFTAKPQANASGDAYLYQQMVNSGMSTEEALDRLGKMSPQTKFEQEIALKQFENDIATGGQIARDNNQFQNNVVLKGIEHQNQLDLEEQKNRYANDREMLKTQLSMNLEQFKNSLPTQKMREYQEVAQATGQPVSDLIKNDFEVQKLEAKAKQALIDLNEARMNQAIAETEKTQKETQNIGQSNLTNEIQNYEYVKEHPEAAVSPFFNQTAKKDEDATNLRKEFNQLTKDYRTIGDSYSRILQAADKKSAAGDLSLIFNYMKMLDPNSVVRESEFSNAENARAWFDETGAPTFVKLAYNKATTGQKLLDNQREDFVEMARYLMEAQKSSFNQYAKQFTNIALEKGLNPEQVVFDPYEDLMSKKNGNTDNNMNVEQIFEYNEYR